MDTTSTISLAGRIAERCTDFAAESIAAAVGSMIGSGDLRHGDRLPTIRALAGELAVSSSTVAEAWRVLRHHGLIETARRNGTVVRAARTEMTGRYWRVPATAGSSVLDLSTGTPDTDLLPTMDTVLASLHADIAITSYIDRPVLVELEEVLRSRWPFVAEEMTVVDGCLDALDRLIRSSVGFGDTVVVEDPTFPPILDMLERAGARIVGVPLDEHGIELDSLATALDRRPTLAMLQPAAHNPTGRSMSNERAEAAAALFAERSPDTWIVEDHHAGDLIRNSASLGVHLPDRVVRIHSFSKSHGPDLRIAAVGGAAEPIASVVDRRRLGPSWTSRLVQTILLTMLRDREVDALVGHAVEVYAGRRRVICEGLAVHGIDVDVDAAGFNLWIPVANEQRAVLALAFDGIGVAPGAPFRLDTGVGADHIRISVGNARGDLDPVVASIAAAASA